MRSFVAVAITLALLQSASALPTFDKRAETEGTGKGESSSRSLGGCSNQHGLLNLALLTSTHCGQISPANGAFGNGPSTSGASGLLPDGGVVVFYLEVASVASYWRSFRWSLTRRWRGGLLPGVGADGLLPGGMGGVFPDGGVGDLVPAGGAGGLLPGGGIDGLLPVVVSMVSYLAASRSKRPWSWRDYNFGAAGLGVNNFGAGGVNNFGAAGVNNLALEGLAIRWCWTQRLGAGGINNFGGAGSMSGINNFGAGGFNGIGQGVGLGPMMAGSSSSSSSSSSNQQSSTQFSSLGAGGINTFGGAGGNGFGAGGINSFGASGVNGFGAGGINNFGGVGSNGGLNGLDAGGINGIGQGVGLGPMMAGQSSSSSSSSANQQSSTQSSSTIYCEAKAERQARQSIQFFEAPLPGGGGGGHLHGGDAGAGCSNQAES
ncbi:hypothetical protein KEM48_009410 [Puccinia striiformis f. sp. tritici PST-130]|nr:hypothetical protein KEM48_009410 [Puccinia striiformis f. sp. tritici PST-130]